MITHIDMTTFAIMFWLGFIIINIVAIIYIIQLFRDREHLSWIVAIWIYLMLLGFFLMANNAWKEWMSQESIDDRNRAAVCEKIIAIQQRRIESKEYRWI